MKNKYFLDTPLLFLIFNRLDTTKKVFKEIQKAKPKKLYIASDGARNKMESIKVKKIRKYVLDNIDWECDVKTLFRKRNLGCKYAVSTGIDWFFNHEEKGIILEDDCLPSQSFFKFCQHLLQRYEEDERIMYISGTNVEIKSNIEKDYFFSKSYNIWGWATWRRAWKYYDVKVRKWPEFKRMGWMRVFSRNLFDNFENTRGMDNLYNGKIDTWDYQWSFCVYNKQWTGYYSKSKSYYKYWI